MPNEAQGAAPGGLPEGLSPQPLRLTAMKVLGAAPTSPPSSQSLVLLLGFLWPTWPSVDACKQAETLAKVSAVWGP